MSYLKGRQTLLLFGFRLMRGYCWRKIKTIEHHKNNQFSVSKDVNTTNNSGQSKLPASSLMEDCAGSSCLCVISLRLNVGLLLGLTIAFFIDNEILTDTIFV